MIFHSVVTLHCVRKICNGFDLHSKEDCQIVDLRILKKSS